MSASAVAGSGVPGIGAGHRSQPVGETARRPSELLARAQPNETSRGRAGTRFKSAACTGSRRSRSNRYASAIAMPSLYREIDLVLNIPKNDTEDELTNDYIIRREGPWTTTSR